MDRNQEIAVIVMRLQDVQLVYHKNNLSFELTELLQLS